MYFLLALLFSRYSPLYLCLFLFSSAFLSPYSAYFGALSNFLARFSGLALRLLLLVFFFGRSVSFFSSYFHSKPSLHKLELQQFPPVDKALALPVLLLCELIRNCKILRITVQLQHHKFDFPLAKRGLQIICLRGFTSTCPREALMQCLTVCPRYATLRLDTRICALHCHLPVSPGAH